MPSASHVGEHWRHQRRADALALMVGVRAQHREVVVRRGARRGPSPSGRGPTAPSRGAGRSRRPWSGRARTMPRYDVFQWPGGSQYAAPGCPSAVYTVGCLRWRRPSWAKNGRRYLTGRGGSSPKSHCITGSSSKASASASAIAADVVGRRQPHRRARAHAREPATWEPTRMGGRTAWPRSYTPGVPPDPIAELGARAKAASRVLATTSTEVKDAALLAAADLLLDRHAEILSANADDVAAAEAAGQAATVVDRLRLSDMRLLAMANGLRAVAAPPRSRRRGRRRLDPARTGCGCSGSGCPSAWWRSSTRTAPTSPATRSGCA